MFTTAHQHGQLQPVQLLEFHRAHLGLQTHGFGKLAHTLNWHSPCPLGGPLKNSLQHIHRAGCVVGPGHHAQGGEVGPYGPLPADQLEALKIALRAGFPQANGAQIERLLRPPGFWAWAWDGFRLRLRHHRHGFGHACDRMPVVEAQA